MADGVGDGPVVLSGEDVRGVAGEGAAEAGQAGGEVGAQEQGAGADGVAGDHHHPRLHPVVAGIPLRGGTLFPRLARPHPHRHRPLLDAQHLRARDHLHPGALRVRELHAVRPLLGGVGAAEVAEAGAAAAAQVQRELLRPVAHRPRTLQEEPVVVIDQLLRQQVDVVLLHVLPRAALHVGVVQPRHPPGADHPLRRGQRHAGIDHRAAPVGPPEGQRQSPLRAEEAAVGLVERRGHLQLAPGELVGRAAAGRAPAPSRAGPPAPAAPAPAPPCRRPRRSRRSPRPPRCASSDRLPPRRVGRVADGAAAAAGRP